MTTNEPAESAGGISLAQCDVQQVVDTLVARAILTPEQAPAAVEALTAPSAPPTRVAAREGRGRAAEVAGYVGGALVVSAGGLFLTTSWSSLSRTQRGGLLAGLALVLASAGAALAWSAGLADLRRNVDPVKRRLVSTLWAGAAWSAGSATYLAVSPFVGSGNFASAWLLGGAVALTVSAAAYALVPSLVGQVAVWVAIWWFTASLVELLHLSYTHTFGIVFVVLGAGWATLGVRGVLRERETALALGVLMALFGAQAPLLEGTAAVAYVLTGVVALACFAAHLRVRGWPLLAGGVAATTLVVPEAVRDLTDSAMPVTGLLLVAGVTLLVTSAIGLRLRAVPDASADD